MSVTRQNLRDIQAGIDPHLKALSEKLGLHLKWGSATYGATGYLKIEIAATSSDGKAMTAEALAFEACCGNEGLEKEDLWGVFTTSQGTFQLVGYNVRAPKMPLLVKNMADGKSYKFRSGLFKTSKAPPITRETASAAE